MKIFPIILSGGSGSRLWPLSRSSYPKQFIDLVSEDSLIAETLSRIKDSPFETEPPVIVCNEEHRFLLKNLLDQNKIQSTAIILEPCSRNTAPAVMLASFYLKLNMPADSLILVLPADHLIKDDEEFHKSISKCIKEAEDNKLAVFGVSPTHPHTGYGYIECDNEQTNERNLRRATNFYEKPDLLKAQEYIEHDNFFWNSGIFLFKNSFFIESIYTTERVIHDCTEKAMKEATLDHEFIRPEAESFTNCPSVSIDYALMEKTNEHDIPVTMSILDAGWRDVGSWNSLFESLPRDKENNSIEGDVISLNTNNSLLHSSKGVLTAIGLEDMLVVNTPDAVLVGRLSESENVKDIVEKLKTENREEAIFHRKVHRPWGTYDNLDEEDGFKIKRIKVNPHSQLSLQLHHHRSEHWVVVEGEATVTRGSDVIVLNKNESTFIPLGMKHSLGNNTDSMLEIIEVQIGDYLGEDDIVRFKDDYGRAD